MFLPSLTSYFFVNFNCKGERLQVVEIPRKREKIKVKKNYELFGDVLSKIK